MPHNIPNYRDTADARFLSALSSIQNGGDGDANRRVAAEWALIAGRLDAIMERPASPDPVKPLFSEDDRTVADLATHFADLPNDTQAKFFDCLALIARDCPDKSFHKQGAAIGKHLSEEGRHVVASMLFEPGTGA